MRLDPNRRILILTATLLAAAGPAMAGGAFGLGARPRDFADISYATWTDDEPGYRLYPGDQIEVATPTAPELTRVLTVGPDGRISLPLIGSVMAADRALPELEMVLSQAYATQLVRPDVEVTLKQAAPMKVLVGGEVNTPGWVEMSGDLDSLQAVMAAGGPKGSAKLGQVVIIRRGPGGHLMRRTVDLSRGLRQPGRSDLVPLRRFDIVYVPRSGLAEADVYMGQIRDLLPFSFSYAPPVR
ncbi:MAG: polysaccharide export protein [Proteobacteria bacterium]|nr:polysaccharide export protein [Pseudomonadota bacterium]